MAVRRFDRRERAFSKKRIRSTRICYVELTAWILNAENDNVHIDCVKWQIIDKPINKLSVWMPWCWRTRKSILLFILLFSPIFGKYSGIYIMTLPIILLLSAPLHFNLAHNTNQMLGQANVKAPRTSLKSFQCKYFERTCLLFDAILLLWFARQFYRCFVVARYS